jgi:tetratricopeptide (TPR) repeat protein
MNKNYFLVGAVCLLAGCVIGFVFANSLNRNATDQTSVAVATNSNSAISPNHPALDANRMPQADVQAAIDLAKNEPENFEAQTKAAAMYYQIERFEPAIELLKKANRLKPDDYGTKVNLGNAYFEAGQYEEAEKWYAATLARNADDINVRTDLGLTFLLRQPPNLDRAVKEFTRSLEKDPNHAPTLQNLTIAFTKKDDAAKAKETLNRLEKLSADNPAITKLRDDIQKLESK